MLAANVAALPAVTRNDFRALSVAFSEGVEELRKERLPRDTIDCTKKISEEHQYYLLSNTHLEGKTG